MCPSEFDPNFINPSLGSALEQAGDLAWENALAQHSLNNTSLWNAIDTQLDADKQLHQHDLPADLAHMFMDNGFLSTYADDPANLPHDTRNTFERWLPAMPSAQQALQDFTALNRLIRQYFIRAEATCPVQFDETRLVNQALTPQQPFQSQRPTHVSDVIPFPKWAMAAAAAISLIVVVGAQQQRPLTALQPSYISSIPSPEAFVLDQCNDVLPDETDPAWIIYNCTLGI